MNAESPLAEGACTVYSSDADEYNFIDVDELVDFEQYYSGSVLDLTPQNPEEYEIRVYNNGSESIEFSWI